MSPGCLVLWDFSAAVPSAPRSGPGWGCRPRGYNRLVRNARNCSRDISCCKYSTKSDLRACRRRNAYSDSRRRVKMVWISSEVNIDRSCKSNNGATIWSNAACTCSAMVTGFAGENENNLNQERSTEARPRRRCDHGAAITVLGGVPPKFLTRR